MAKNTISFKPTPECEQQLASLMNDWKCDRTAALIRAVDVAMHAELDKLQEAANRREFKQHMDPEADQELTQAGERLSKAVRRQEAAFSRPRIDRDKIAAAQRTFRMGGVGKK